MHNALERVVQTITETYRKVKFFQYSEFEDIKEIGTGGYGTVYKAKCKSLDEGVVVLKRFKKNFDQIQMSEIFTAEVGNHNHWTDL
jgi:serine/threonine protein kinase